jgi:hypothetical protein
VDRYHSGWELSIIILCGKKILSLLLDEFVGEISDVVKQ